MIQAAALLPVVTAIGTEVPFHLPNVFLLPAQVRHLPAAQPTAPGSMANACPLSDLAAIHTALEAAWIGSVLRGRVPLLVRALAITPISRVGRSRRAERQCRDYRHCYMEVLHGCFSWLKTREPAFRTRGKSLRESS